MTVYFLVFFSANMPLTVSFATVFNTKVLPTQFAIRLELAGRIRSKSVKCRGPFCLEGGWVLLPLHVHSSHSKCLLSFCVLQSGWKNTQSELNSRGPFLKATGRLLSCPRVPPPQMIWAIGVGPNLHPYRPGSLYWMDSGSTLLPTCEWTRNWSSKFCSYTFSTTGHAFPCKKCENLPVHEKIMRNANAWVMSWEMVKTHESHAKRMRVDRPG